MRVICEPPWLVAELGSSHAVASWAVVGGGLGLAERVAWLQVHNADLAIGVDPAALMDRRLADRGCHGAVGMITSASVARHQRSSASEQGSRADVLATVGLSNRLAVGDPPGPHRPGTINLLIQVNQPLTTAGLLEALSIAVEARTRAVLQLKLQSVASEGMASGTGTDCVVVAAPLERANAQGFAGKHTALGSAVGQAVLAAVEAGGRDWIRRH